MNIIKKIRKENNLSQQEFAKLFNVHQTAVSQWETGKTNPDSTIAKSISEHFNISLDIILSNSDTNTTLNSKNTFRLKELRELEQLSQDSFSEIIGMSRSAISMWETGGSQPDTNALIKLADHFNVSVDYLLGRSNDPAPPQENENYLLLNDTEKGLILDFRSLSPEGRAHILKEVDITKNNKDDLSPLRSELMNKVGQMNKAELKAAKKFIDLLCEFEKDLTM